MRRTCRCRGSVDAFGARLVRPLEQALARVRDGRLALGLARVVPVADARRIEATALSTINVSECLAVKKSAAA